MGQFQSAARCHPFRLVVAEAARTISAALGHADTEEHVA
jgi:hypothetical protein